MGYWASLVVFLVLQLHILVAARKSVRPTFEKLYQVGVTSYNEGKWFECAAYIERAIEDFQFYNEHLPKCRLDCQLPSLQSDLKVNKFGLELSFFSLAIKRTLCLKKCNSKVFAERPGLLNLVVTEEVMEDFQSLKPYDYLQICAYKNDNYEKAAGAAYTFLLRHPEHEVMVSNVEYYKSMKEVKADNFKNLEPTPHQDYYLQGVDAYNVNDWEETVKNMKHAIEEYFIAETRCSALCEGPYATATNRIQEVYESFSESYLKVLRCKAKCPIKLGTIYGSYVPDYLADHYHYLQYANYRMDDIDNACLNTGNFLLLKPNDEVMIANKESYLAMEGVNERKFKPEENLKDYLDRVAFEEDILATVAGTVLDPGLDHVPGLIVPKFGPKDEAYRKKMGKYEKEGVTVIKADEQLQGENRVAADGLLNEDECQNLIQLAGIGAEKGDGYILDDDQTSPYSKSEKFEGIRVEKAAELAQQGKLTATQANLFLKASNKGLDFLHQFLNLDMPLYFTYTHLVCRTALQDQGEEVLSHPVHADNCHIQKDGTCLKEPPAFVWRDFSALLYLNDDFEGGDFFFAHNNESVQERVKPKCGRIVGFPGEDYHGVEAVKKGKRCALAMWFTIDPYYKEKAHESAAEILSAMDSRQRKLQDPKLKKLLDKTGVELTLMEEELKGPERFAADKVISEEECATLIKLANDGGVVNDGYRSANKNRPSPHSNHEKFVGLSISYAAEEGGQQGDGYQMSPSKTTSPHTNHEKFEGLTVSRAAQLAAEHLVDIEGVQLYLDMSEKGKNLVQTYFGLDKPLYFDYTHLVCRTALDETKTDRDDLSHPIHADNCSLQPDGSCPKMNAYTQRDYSAIMYLNDDFEGGDFIFTHANASVQSTLRPRCGRLVGFNSSNFHGVKAVVKGQRCAIALWYTLDKRFDEQARKDAKDIIKTISNKPHGPSVQYRPKHGEL